MSVEQVGLALKPNGYPAENPGMDLLPVAMT
jgi:Cu2+-containing amine oxidase